MQKEPRVVLDCRKSPEGNCSLAISGTEEEVLEIGELHATTKHGFKKTPELKNQLRGYLKTEAVTR